MNWLLFWLGVLLIIASVGASLVILYEAWQDEWWKAVAGYLCRCTSSTSASWTLTTSTSGR